jgi:lipoprotein-anchoring transpeptidase ErfK/SrfK
MIGIPLRGAAVRSTTSASRRRALPVVALSAAAVLVVLAAGTYLYDHSRRDLIANGVRIDGVSVGGLREDAARRKVQDELIAQVNRPITVRWGSRRWTLSGREADVRVDVPSMIAEAVAVSREGSILTRTLRGLSGGSVNRNIPLAVSYSHHAVRSLTVNVREAVNRAPRDATVQPTTSGLTELPARVGVTVYSRRLGARIESVLTGGTASRAVTVPTRTIKPAVSSGQLAARYPAYIVIDRGSFTLRLYEHLKLAKRYEIAVGMEGLETPAGLHHVEWKQEDPPWYVPKKAWAGALAGTVVPPGPADPLKARFMSFDGGAGIHGIDPSEYGTIGHDASHGCVRMRIPDVIALYSRTPVGTPVYIL